MGDRERGCLSAPVPTGHDAVSLEEEALVWVEPYWNAEHLVRTRDWVVELEPQAGEAVRLAALTHDMERHVPGGPVQDLTDWPEDEAEDEYRRLLYVAMTRAADRLVVAGSRGINRMPDGCWYQLIETALKADLMMLQEAFARKAATTPRPAV